MSCLLILRIVAGARYPWANSILYVLFSYLLFVSTQSWKWKYYSWVLYSMVGSNTLMVLWICILIVTCSLACSFPALSDILVMLAFLVIVVFCKQIAYQNMYQNKHSFCPLHLGSNLSVPTQITFYSWKIRFLRLDTSILDRKYRSIEFGVSMQGHVSIRGPQHTMQLLVNLSNMFISNQNELSKCTCQLVGYVTHSQHLTLWNSMMFQFVNL